MRAELLRHAWAATLAWCLAAGLALAVPPAPALADAADAAVADADDAAVADVAAADAAEAADDDTAEAADGTEVPDDAEPARGWRQVGDRRCLYGENGEPLSGWQQDGEAWYYLDDDGAPRTGWTRTLDGWFYLGSDGAMATGWLRYAGSWYWLGHMGRMHRNEWARDGGHWYYLGEDGRLRTGWLWDEGSWYHLHEGRDALLGAWDGGSAPNHAQLRARLHIQEEFHAEFAHGEKGAAYQRWIVLHDTEGEGAAINVVTWWLMTGEGVATHFVVGRDGTIVQCVPLDQIAHHAGVGNKECEERFGVADSPRDDAYGEPNPYPWPVGRGMNAWSVGIELVHRGGGLPYTEAQLTALDGLIAYIDAYYGFESGITDHKAWRIGNSDTSPEFAAYLRNYQDHRTYR